MKTILLLSILLIAGCSTNNEPLDAIIDAEITIKEANALGFAETGSRNYDKTQKLIAEAKTLNSRNKIKAATEKASKANRLANDYIISFERYQRQKSRN